MRTDFDLVIRGGRVVTPEGVRRADIGVAEGKFAQIAPEISGESARVISAQGRLVFPGIIDAHVHFNEPGRTHWEGFATGSAALAAGGGTAFFDMPLNSLPPVIDRESLELKRAAGERSSIADFGLWGGLVPGNVGKLEGLRDGGVVGFKAFMCESGVPEFARVDPATLKAGMACAAALGVPLAVHAEDEDLARRRSAEQRAKGSDVRSWLASRPVEVELEAIRTALELAGETGCALHIVHVSSPEGVSLAFGARERGVDVTVETCPHYLLLTDDDVVRLGAPAKCAPILRSEASRRALWSRMEEGMIDTIGSDHSPAPPEMKESPDFFAIWGGISGCQHGFALLISEALRRESEMAALPRLAALLSARVARRFGLAARKGRIEEGLDADFSILDTDSEHRLSNSSLLYRHRQGPYDGRSCRVKILRTVVRGRTVFADGQIAESPHFAHYLGTKPA